MIMLLVFHDLIVYHSGDFALRDEMIHFSVGLKNAPKNIFNKKVYKDFVSFLSLQFAVLYFFSLYKYLVNIFESGNHYYV